MAHGDKYKSKKQLKKEGLMEKGGVIPSSPSWKNRMHKLVDRFKAPAFVGTPPSSVDWVKDTVVPKRKRKDKKKKVYDGGTLPEFTIEEHGTTGTQNLIEGPIYDTGMLDEVTIETNVPKRRVKKELKRKTKKVKK
tara:strand:+ start:330 stop:737 length:408 start_codon:yes stop_codon:yes gene_type:complete